MTLTLLAVAWLLTYLLHSTILLGGAWLLSATGIVRSPDARDTLWKVCLVGGILTATVYSAVPYQPYSAHLLLPGVAPSAPAAVRVDIPAVQASADLKWPSQPVRRSSVPAARLSVASDLGLAAVSSPTPNTQSPTPSWPRLLLGLWMLGAAALLVRAFVCRVRLTRSLRRRREITEGPVAEMLDSLRAAAGVRRPIRLTASAELAGPVAMGTSEICLPERALTGLSPAEQRAVLAHELGHLVRQDPLWLGLSVACESLFFLQPLNRLARRRIQEAAEYLCDDWAVHQTGGSLTLAKCLAEVATWIEAAPRAVPVSGMAENGSQLVERVHRLLEGAQPSVRRMRMAVPVAALALSSMAFAAPGISPPCDQDVQAPAAHVQASRSPARTLVQGGPQAWATIRDGHLVTFREGFAPRLTGQGHLGIRRGGREIELGDGQRLLVNGREPSDERVVQVCESDSLRIVDQDGRTLWQVEPVRLSPEKARAWAEVSPAAETWSQAEARAEAAADVASDRVDSLEEQFDSLGDRFDVLDTMDTEAVTRAAVELSDRVTRSVNVQVAPQIAQIQEMGVRIGTEIAPRMAELGARMVGEIVPAIVQSVCGSGLCDSSSAPVRRTKTLPKHRR